jgi:MFS family permease
MLTSASSISQLAGVLGGFLITAIALLFDRRNRESVQTLALFAAAVLILMLDSFLFSIISGSVAPDDGDRRGLCAIVWTQGALSTGMLAAGTTALFGGLGWMLAGHAVNEASERDFGDLQSFSFLADLGGWLTFGSAMTMTLVLSETSIDYLHFMFGERPELWVVGLITTSAALIIVVDFALVYLRTKSLRNSLLDTAVPTQLALRSVKVASVGILGLAIIGSWLTMSLARFPKDWLTVPNTGAVVFVLLLTYIVPSVVSTAICYSVASADNRGAR